MKRHRKRDTWHWQRAYYTVYPLGWRGPHHWGGPKRCGEVIECPKCGRRGLTVPGHHARYGRHAGEWLPTMVMHRYPPYMVSEMICCLFDQPPTETGPGGV